jgi:hypothetical protein
MYYLFDLRLLIYFKNVGIPKFEFKYIGFYEVDWYMSPNLSEIINLLLSVIVNPYTFFVKNDYNVGVLDYDSYFYWVIDYDKLYNFTVFDDIIASLLCYLFNT